MLELKNLRLTAEDGQGKVDILKDVSLSVADGEFLVITGPNGGGKTSLAKTVMGLMQPSGGQIIWNGEDVTDLSITERARRGISYGFQQPPRFKGLKVRDLLAIAAGKTLGHDEGGHTIVIISHQERIIRLADEIVLIADGKVAGRGSVDELYPRILADTVAGCNMLEVNGQC